MDRYQVAVTDMLDLHVETAYFSWAHVFTTSCLMGSCCLSVSRILCCVFVLFLLLLCFVCLRSVSCIQCCLWIWFVQCNGKKKKDKRTNNDLQNTTQKTKDRSTQTSAQKRRWTYLLRKEFAVPPAHLTPVVYIDTLTLQITWQSKHW
jgi:hypothetical protein